MKKCNNCGNNLVGIQRRWCSSNCSSKFWNKNNRVYTHFYSRRACNKKSKLNIINNNIRLIIAAMTIEDDNIDTI